MKAVRFAVGRPFAPFEDPVGQTPVLAGTLAEAQERTLRAAGFDPTDTPPAGEPYLVYADRAWFTASFLRALRAAGEGRARITDPTFLAQTGNLQSDPGRPELAIVRGPPTLDAPDVVVELALRPADPLELHPAFAHAQRPMVTGPRLVHSVEHWTHALRVNLLAMLATAEEGKADFEAAPLWSKIWTALRVLWRARGFTRYALARGLNRIGKGCRIHPTAVVEASQLGDGVEVGAYALVRGCVVGDGAKIEDYAHATVSVVGAGARLGRTCMFNFCVAAPGAFVSAGGGWQMSIFGRDSFVAMTATGYDLSFGQPIRVASEQGIVSADTHFLGICVGHRAKIGAHARIGYGMAIPNDSFVVAPSGDVLRRWPEPVEGPVTIRDGRAVPVR